jgi:hypothetical protein
MAKPAKKAFEADMEVEKYNDKGDKIQLTPVLTKGGAQSTWLLAQQVTEQCGRLEVGEKVKLLIERAD